MADYRSDRMPSPEGQGLARSRWSRAWDAYAGAVNRTPVVQSATRWLAGRKVEDLVGFWLLWHLEGGFEGLQRVGMSRSAIYRRVAAFRSAFGVHPDEFVFPGVAIDLDAYLSASGTVVADRATHPGFAAAVDAELRGADTPV